tara:strand:+ start:288 stop:749 length:462 start_codon:yes stop_codon:yes gene_type:complete
MNKLAPLRHDCESNENCFNKFYRLKFNKLNDLFSGNIAMTDIDGAVERNGWTLFIEWKSYADGQRNADGYNKKLSAQERMFLSLYKAAKVEGQIETILVVGDAEHMTVEQYATIQDCPRGNKFGVNFQWQKADFDGLREEIKHWADWAESHKL